MAGEIFVDKHAREAGNGDTGRDQPQRAQYHHQKPGSRSVQPPCQTWDDAGRRPARFEFRSGLDQQRDTGEALVEFLPAHIAGAESWIV